MPGNRPLDGLEIPRAVNRDGSAVAQASQRTPHVNRDRPRERLLPEELADEVLEVVDAVLALGAEAAGVVGA